LSLSEADRIKAASDILEDILRATPVPLEEPPSDDLREHVLKAWRLLNGFTNAPGGVLVDPAIPYPMWIVRAPLTPGKGTR